MVLRSSSHVGPRLMTAAKRQDRFWLSHLFLLCLSSKFSTWGTGGILFREYCFGEEDSLSLTEFYGELGEFCEKLGEFALAHK